MVIQNNNNISSRMLTFEYYPNELTLNFCLSQLIKECKSNIVDADKYYKTKTTTVGITSNNKEACKKREQLLITKLK
jgi:hypothetical protein